MAESPTNPALAQHEQGYRVPLGILEIIPAHDDPAKYSRGAGRDATSLYPILRVSPFAVELQRALLMVLWDRLSVWPLLRIFGPTQNEIARMWDDFERSGPIGGRRATIVLGCQLVGESTTMHGGLVLEVKSTPSGYDWSVSIHT